MTNHFHLVLRSSPLGIVAAGLLTAAAFYAPCVQAESPASSYPNRPVTIITPFPTGSGPDVVLRLLSERLSQHWNQRVLVDNRPGAAGFIAINAAGRAAPDGYTLLQVDSEHVSAHPYLYRERGFRPLETFTPVAVLYRTSFMVAVSKDSPFKSMTDLIEAGKLQGGRMNYGSWGLGSAGHLGGARLEAEAGITMQHVPYREMSQLFTSVASGDLAWSFGSIPSSQGTFQAGKIRYLAVAAPKRIPQFPDVPTVAEAGGPAGFDVSSFAAILAPKGLDTELQSKINADIAKGLSDPQIKARFETFAFESLQWSSAEILRQIEAKARTYEAVIRRSNIKLD